MRVGTFLIMGCFLGLTLTKTAWAQDAPAPPKPPAFPIVFARPTGINGYEEWVQAGDAIQNNADVDEADEPDATLTFKRHVLAEPPVQRALALLRAGLNKPVQPPQRKMDENTRYPEFTPFRKLGRLLAVEIYVRFADGRGDEAVESLSHGMRFGYRMQGGALIGSLSGMAVQMKVLQAFALHFKQLSEYQCRRVEHLAEDWQQSPSLAALMLQQEKRYILDQLDRKRANPNTLQEIAESDEEEADDPDVKAIQAFARQSPPNWTAMFDRAKILAAGYYDDALANQTLPAWKRKPLPFPRENTPGGHLLGVICPDVNRIAVRHDEMLAMIRLLGVHAAIHRYRWEQNFLPNSLADLHVGHLAEDPLTGSSFRYEQQNNRYDLSSPGTLQYDAQGRLSAVHGEPVRL